MGAKVQHSHTAGGNRLTGPQNLPKAVIPQLPDPAVKAAAIAATNPAANAFKGATPILAIDCEMVECASGKKLARLCIVNYNGHTVYDQYFRPEERVIDFLTFVSGITPALIKTAPFWTQEKAKVG